MSDDLLSRATRSLREETEASAAAATNDGALTLARVERSLRGGAGGAEGAARTRRRRGMRARWVVWPIAAVFVVMTAWASASGRLAGWWGVMVGGTGSESERQEDRDRDGGRERARGASLAPAPALAEAAPSASEAEAAPSASASASGSEAAPSTAAAPTTTAAAPTTTASSAGSMPWAKAANTDGEQDRLYRVAHEAQFGRQDYAGAVGAWDQYLRVAGPGGRFTLEARYNRAVALVKTGRSAEARAALRPFADGEYGGYRRDDARALLRSLD